MRLSHLILLIAALEPIATLGAGEPAPKDLRTTVIQFLESETRAYEGKVSIEVPEAGLPTTRRQCANPEAFLVTGRQAWGKIMVGLRCRTPQWTLYVPARIKVESDYMVAARPLASGSTLVEADLKSAHGDIAALPAGTLTRSDQIKGRTLRMAISSGVALRTDQFLPNFAIQRGQKVRVLSRGEGFEVSNEGVALAAAVEGQAVQVRISSGKVLQGLARAAGIVEITQ